MNDSDRIRDRLDELIRNSADDYASISRLLNRNAAYIQQFIKRGVPKKLDGDDRRTLARHFNVTESELGGPIAKRRARPLLSKGERQPDDYLLIPYFSAIGASAGAGALLSEAELAESALAFQARWVSDICKGNADLLSVIKVQGDSMLPTLGDGDPILVDRGDASEHLRDGIYVMRTDDTLLVKRVSRSPAGRRIRVTSDNDIYPDIGECDPAEIDIIGRVIWVGRQLR